MVIVRSNRTHINPLNGCSVPDETIYFWTGEVVIRDGVYEVRDIFNAESIPSVFSAEDYSVETD